MNSSYINRLRQAHQVSTPKEQPRIKVTTYEQSIYSGELLMKTRFVKQ